MSQAADPSAPTRKIRPSIAALLTLFGWGLGLYYAGRPRAAWWAVWLSVGSGLILGFGVLAFLLTTNQIPAFLYRADRLGLLDYVSWGLSALAAIVVWVVAAQRQTAPRAGTARLFGYVLIFFAPIVISLVLAMSIRCFAFQPFRMPSGSMQPTVSIGDYVLVSKSAYGYSRFSFAPLESLFPEGRWRSHDPQHGDLVVTRTEADPDRDFVKRLIGLPGDRIQMIDGVLNINGAAVVREPLPSIGIEGFGGEVDRVAALRETLPNGVSYTILDRGLTELDNTRVLTVPDGHYFVIGDDRDNSMDSRVPTMGMIPRDYLIGRVDRVIRAE